MFDEEPRKDKFPFGPVIFFVTVIALFFLMGFLSLQVNAAEEETLTDEERLNYLEIRLEELGYQISEMGNSIVSIQEDAALQEENRLALSDKLDLVVIALNNLIENDLAEAAYRDQEALATDSYRESILQSLTDQGMTIAALNENTVSGNSLVSDFNDSVEENLQLVSENTLQELNKTLLSTNTFLSYLFVLMLIVLVLIIVYGLGALLNKLFKHVS